MGQPYEPAPIGGIVIPNTTPVVVPLGVPSRTRIYKLIVKEVGGVAAAFKVDVYSNAEAAEGNNNVDENGNNVPPANYKVTGQFSGTGGIMEYYADKATGGFGFPFYNQDPPDTHKTRNKRQIYLVITLDGGGPFTFAVSIGCDSAELQ